jgi:DNA-binding winged helix-turn-helix (wHTH) protein
MKIGTQRLARHIDFLTCWQRAARNALTGRPERAHALYVRALRNARAIGHTPAVRMVLAGIQDQVVGRYGPPTTPMFAPRGFRGPILTLKTPFNRMRLKRRQVEGLSKTCPFELLVDCTRQRVLVNGKELPLEGREVPLQILASLIRAQGGPLTLEELFPRAWGRPFNPAFDANTVYFHISRLRKLLETAAPGFSVLSTSAEGYLLAPGLRYALVEEERRRKRPGRDRTAILEMLADRRFVDNRSYCEITGVSRSTALRELAQLVQEGVLVREGAGRGARYRVATRTHEPPSPMEEQGEELPEAQAA